MIGRRTKAEAGPQKRLLHYDSSTRDELTTYIKVWKALELGKSSTLEMAYGRPRSKKLKNQTDFPKDNIHFLRLEVKEKWAESLLSEISENIGVEMKHKLPREDLKSCPT